ncbi:hypothetical protein Neosp_015086 [[Neocosmospora] mangrovei]
MASPGMNIPPSKYPLTREDERVYTVMWCTPRWDLIHNEDKKAITALTSKYPNIAIATHFSAESVSGNSSVALSQISHLPDTPSGLSLNRMWKAYCKTEDMWKKAGAPWAMVKSFRYNSNSPMQDLRSRPRVFLKPRHFRLSRTPPPPAANPFTAQSALSPAGPSQQQQQSTPSSAFLRDLAQRRSSVMSRQRTAAESFRDSMHKAVDAETEMAKCMTEIHELGRLEKEVKGGLVEESPKERAKTTVS